MAAQGGLQPHLDFAKPPPDIYKKHIKWVEQALVSPPEIGLAPTKPPLENPSAAVNMNILLKINERFHKLGYAYTHLAVV